MHASTAVNHHRTHPVPAHPARFCSLLPLLVLLLPLSQLSGFELTGGLGGLNPPTSTFQTHYFSKNIDLIDKNLAQPPHLTFWQFDHCNCCSCSSSCSLAGANNSQNWKSESQTMTAVIETKDRHPGRQAGQTTSDRQTIHTTGQTDIIDVCLLNNVWVISEVESSVSICYPLQPTSTRYYVI